MIRIAVVDDEENVSQYISRKINESLQRFDFKANIEIFNNSRIFLEQNKKQYFDIIFLDLEMPEPDGMQTARIIREDYPNIVIVIITNREELVFGTFQYDVSAFIRKKYFEAEIDPVVERVYKKAKNNLSKYILKTEYGEKLFNINDIVFIESENHNIFLHDKNNNIIKIFYTLEKVESILSEEIFVRSHSGIIVNCNYIFSINSEDITLTNDLKLPLSRGKRKEVKKRFQKFMRCL